MGYLKELAAATAAAAIAAAVFSSRKCYVTYLPTPNIRKKTRFEIFYC
jgi:hypothetical protein